MTTASGTGTLRTRHLMPISGHEYEFASSPWHHDTESANCYSYAIGNFKLGGSYKPQPGDISRAYDDLRRGYNLNSDPTWRNCVDIRKRIEADGVAAWRLLGFSGQGRTIKVMNAEDVARPGSYKIMTFTDSSVGLYSPTDYHVYRQDACGMSKIYKMPLFGYVGSSSVRGSPSPYDELNIDPFVSGNHLEDYGSLDKIAQTDAFKKISGEQNTDGIPAHLARSMVNVNLHVSRVPEYIIHEDNFIPDPFWILGVNPFRPESEALIYGRQRDLQKIFANNPFHLMTVNQATKDCLMIRTNPRLMPPKQMLIGLWSHKLGWASDPLNTDADLKLIFDPRRANRAHTDMKYNNICTTFSVLRGQGIAHVPES